MNSLKYFLLLFLALPFIPYMIFQGYAIRKKVPKLAAPKDIYGTIGSGNQPLKLLCIGESTFAGIGVKSHQVGIAGKLAAFLSDFFVKKINYEVFAKSGLTAREIFEKLKNEPIQNKPDLIVIGTGANDAFHFNSPSNFLKYSYQSVSFLKNKFPSAPIVFVNMPPVSIFPVFPAVIRFFAKHLVLLYRNELVNFAQKENGVYFDDRIIEEMDWGISERPITDFFSDGVHPSELTYGLWAESIGAFITKIKIISV